MQTAAVCCRYGHQDFFRITGRDPAKQPMTILERELFAKCVIDLYNGEAEHTDIVPKPKED
jgi:hypothetical protein